MLVGFLKNSHGSVSCYGSPFAGFWESSPLVAGIIPAFSEEPSRVPATDIGSYNAVVRLSDDIIG